MLLEKSIRVYFRDESDCSSVLIESVPSFGLKREGKILPKSYFQNIQIEYEQQKTDWKCLRKSKPKANKTTSNPPKPEVLFDSCSTVLCLLSRWFVNRLHYGCSVTGQKPVLR